MAKIISIANQKGGVGKTTTATAFAAGLYLHGKNVLVVDADPQCDTSDTYRADLYSGKTMEHVFTGTSVKEAIRITSYGDILPGDSDLADADMRFTMQGREYILKEALNPIEDIYDYIIIDLPPSLGIITINAFTASNAVIVPAFADRFSLKGLAKLSETILRVVKYSNNSLVVDGILLTKYDKRTVLNRHQKLVMEEMAKTLNTKVFATTIRSSISLPESQTQRDIIYSYAPGSTTARDYRNFVDEYLSTEDMDNAK